MNGITRFQALDGTWILGMTFRANAECMLVKCPYTYTKAEGGGSILQRFGSPQPNHRFGYSTQDGQIYAMHNLWYKSYVEQGEYRETLSLFINSQDGFTNSRVFEFDIKLTPEPATSYDDTVFDTSYLNANVTFQTDMWGGVS